VYERFFALQQRPFSLLPDPDFLFLGEKHSAALDMAELAILNQCSFCVISGEVGAGKTTLLRELLRRLDQRLRVGLVSNTHASFGELMQWIAAAFGLQGGSHSRLELQQRFVDFVIRRYADNQRTLLIIDEAQNLSVAAMEELRMLSNLNSDKDLVLQVMLVGQPGLRQTLRRPELAQFAQRIAVDYHLCALDANETCQYIAHRLTHAGGAASLFDADACRMIHQASGGIPRLINRICDLSLVYAYAQERLLIGPEIVASVLRDQELGGVFGSVHQTLPTFGDSNAGVAECAAPCSATWSGLPQPQPAPDKEHSEPPRRPEKAAERLAAADASAQVSEGLAAPPAAAVVRSAAGAARPAIDAVKATAPPTAVSNRPDPARASTGSRDQSAARPQPQTKKPAVATGAPAEAAPHAVSELYRLVVAAEGKRFRSRRSGAALATSLAVLVTVAVAGWLSRDRLSELVSGLMANLPLATEVAPGAAAALVLRSPGAPQTATSSAGRLTASHTAVRTVASASRSSAD
jgi:type II secretory pathway predicted ATPase ExeA